MRTSLIALTVGSAILAPMINCTTLHGGTTQRPAPIALSANTGDLPVASNIRAQQLLADVKAVEPTIVVDLRCTGSDNFTGAPLPGYEANRALLRHEAAIALARVQQRLVAQGLSLRIFDAYRPIRATNAMVEWTRHADRENLLRDGYIARTSRHNLGVAVDCTLTDLRTGHDLEMGTVFDVFAPEAHTANARGQAATNRAQLRTAMEHEGFENYEKEWWHFAYPVPDPVRFDLVIR